MDRSIKYMLIASLLFAVMNVLVKSIPDVPVAQIVFMRSLVMLFIVYVIIRRRRVATFGNNPRLLILRGVFGSLGIALFFYTLQKMPLASAVTVHYLTPIFTALIASLFNREKLRLLHWVFFAVCFAGIIMIKGFDERVETLPLILGVIGTIGAASAYNVISYLKGSEHHLVIMFYFPFVTIPLVLAYIFVTGDWKWAGTIEWIVLIGVGVLTYGAQYFLTKSYQFGRVNKVSIVSYLGIIYALAFGFLFFDEWYTLKSLTGLLMVLAGVILSIVIKNKPQEVNTSLAQGNHRV